MAPTNPTATTNPTPAPLRTRLKDAYEKSAAEMDALQTEMNKISAAVMGEVENLNKQIAALQAQVATVEGSLPAKTSVIQTLIDAEQVKLDFLTAKAVEMQAAEANNAKK